MSKLALTIFVVVTLAFFALRLLPGNAIDAQLQGSGLSAEVVAARKADLGLDKPIVLQYADYLLGLVTGDWGQSLYSGQRVLEAIQPRLSKTIPLAAWSIILAISLGIGLGIASGLGSNLAQFVIDLSLGIPIYFTATVLLFIVAARIGGIQRGLLLPVFTLGFHTSGAIARVIDSNLARIQASDFIRTASAKGLHERVILRRHSLKLALLPAIPIIGLQAGVLFSGTVITEVIFQRAGLGLLLLDATLARDYPIVQGVVVLTAIAFLIFKQMAAIIVQILDPRLST